MVFPTAHIKAFWTANVRGADRLRVLAKGSAGGKGQVCCAKLGDVPFACSLGGYARAAAWHGQRGIWRPDSSLPQSDLGHNVLVPSLEWVLPAVAGQKLDAASRAPQVPWYLRRVPRGLKKKNHLDPKALLPPSG